MRINKDKFQAICINNVYQDKYKNCIYEHLIVGQYYEFEVVDQYIKLVNDKGINIKVGYMFNHKNTTFTNYEFYNFFSINE